ncbi:MAG: ribosomal L7Ae/L30e/S12e/Gadd45 family protein [Acetatifactor sp.]|nr:ribosomal L7Ae/L30e/S12e/Gadd45 family protein [Acetatifactor sp.]
MRLWIRSLRVLRQNKVLSLLGLAIRGHNLVSGEFQTENAVKSGHAMLVIVAEDASANTKKFFTDKSSYYGVPIYQYGTKEVLGGAIGKEQRSSLAVCDAGLAQAVMKALEGEGVCQVKGGSEHGKNEGT